METKKIQKITEDEVRKAAAIMHAIEVKSSFELYAYRIISHEEYLSRIEELIQIFQKSTKSSSNSQPYVDPMQLSIPVK